MLGVRSRIVWLAGEPRPELRRLHCLPFAYVYVVTRQRNRHQLFLVRRKFLWNANQARNSL